MVIALGQHPMFPFVLAGNRDEFHARPTRAAHHWEDLPGVIGGRDLEKGGTWLAAMRRGAVAAVTNVRDPSRRLPQARSRGLLVSDFLADPDRATAQQYVESRVAEGSRHDGFNLIAVDASGVWYGSNRGGLRCLDAGVYALSNHLLDTPWPKAQRLKAGAVSAFTASPDDLASRLFEHLADRTPVPDEALPTTGVPIDWERRLAPAFIVSPDYGTRCSTVVTVDRDARLRLEERSFGADGAEIGRVVIESTLLEPIGVGPR